MIMIWLPSDISYSDGISRRQGRKQVDNFGGSWKVENSNFT